MHLISTKSVPFVLSIELIWQKIGLAKIFISNLWLENYSIIVHNVCLCGYDVVSVSFSVSVYIYYEFSSSPLLILFSFKNFKHLAHQLLTGNSMNSFVCICHESSWASRLINKPSLNIHIFLWKIRILHTNECFQLEEIYFVCVKKKLAAHWYS